jgi:hypothetical protein
MVQTRRLALQPLWRAHAVPAPSLLIAPSPEFDHGKRVQHGLRNTRSGRPSCIAVCIVSASPSVSLRVHTSPTPAHQEHQDETGADETGDDVEHNHRYGYAGARAAAIGRWGGGGDVRRLSVSRRIAGGEGADEIGGFVERSNGLALESRVDEVIAVDQHATSSAKLRHDARRRRRCHRRVIDGSMNREGDPTKVIDYTPSRRSYIVAVLSCREKGVSTRTRR